MADHGKLVPDLAPTTVLTSMLDRLGAAGQLPSRTGNGLAGLLSLPPAPDGGTPLSETLPQMRDDQRL